MVAAHYDPPRNFISGISSKIDEANIIDFKRVSKKVIPDDKPKTSVKKLQLRESTVETER